MFITTEETPNPASLKFLADRAVAGEGRSRDFATVDETVGVSPLAERLFAISGVTQVFFGADFITISKDDTVRWQLLKPAVMGVLMEHFARDLPALSESATDAGDAADDSLMAGDADDPVVAQIRELLDTRVRPAVAQDGGDIVFRGFDRGIVYLHMQGACAGCPASSMTLKNGVENLLRHYIPEVVEVQATG